MRRPHFIHIRAASVLWLRLGRYGEPAGVGRGTAPRLVSRPVFGRRELQTCACNLRANAASGRMRLPFAARSGAAPTRLRRPLRIWRERISGGRSRQRLAARVGPKPHAPFQTKTGATPSRTAPAPRAPGAARTRPLPRRLCRDEFARTEFVGKRCAGAPARRRTGKRRRRVRRGDRARRRGRGPALAKPAFGRTDVPRRAAVSRAAARRALILQ